MLLISHLSEQSGFARASAASEHRELAQPEPFDHTTEQWKRLHRGACVLFWVHDLMQHTVPQICVACDSSMKTSKLNAMAKKCILTAANTTAGRMRCDDSAYL